MNEKEIANEILPCPFCGGEAHIDQLSSVLNHAWQVSCDRCDILFMASEEDAVIVMWNTRTNAGNDGN